MTRNPMTPDTERGRAIEASWAESERRTAEVLAAQDPSWGTRIADIGDGIAVLGGPGMFVNELLGTAMARDLPESDLAELERLAAEVGVPAAVQGGSLTTSGSKAALVRRGYVADSDTTSALVWHGAEAPARSENFTIDLVDDTTLGAWQEAAALGWGHPSGLRREASDAIGRAAFVSDEPGLLLARDRSDRRIVGCAALRMLDGVATLGGVSTAPDERRRGVQSALIAHRVRLAIDAGCHTITSQAATNGASERNLLRHGFGRNHLRVRWERPTVP